MSGPGTTRRELIATVAGGTVIGAMWGAAFPVLAMEGRPTIAVVGKDDAQLVLVDSGSARVLVLVGEPDNSLLDRLPAMLTVFRQRIDLVVGSLPALTAHIGALAYRWSLRQAIVLNATSDAPSLPIASDVVSNSLDVTLGNSVTLEIRVGHRDEWRTPVAGTLAPLWSIRVAQGDAAVSIVPDARSFAAMLPGPAAVLVSPSAPSPEVRAKGPTRSLAINFDSESIDPLPADGVALTRIFPRDIGRFVLTEDGVQLPAWTVLADQR